MRMSLDGVAKNINDCSEKYDQLSLKPAYHEVKKDMEAHVPIIGIPQHFGHTFRTKSNNRKRKKTTDMTINDLVNSKTEFPTVVIPMGDDKSVGHAVCVVDDLIFDSTQKTALKLCKDSLDWICGDEGCQEIYSALRFHQKYQTKIIELKGYLSLLKS